jgi:hypothetical protein
MGAGSTPPQPCDGQSAYTIAPLSQSERKDHFEDEQWVRPNVEDSETVSENLA